MKMVCYVSAAMRIRQASADRVIGTIWLERVERVPRPGEPNPQPIGYVTFTFVESAHRNAGVGAALLAALATYAREHDFETLIVWPSDASVRLYERAGFLPPVELRELRLSHDAP